MANRRKILKSTTEEKSIADMIAAIERNRTIADVLEIIDKHIDMFGKHYEEGLVRSQLEIVKKKVEELIQK